MPSRKKDDLKANLNPDDVAECYADYADDMGQMARIKQRIATRFARFQAIGGDPKDIKFAYKLDNMDDAPAFLRGVLKTARILRIIPTETEESGQVSFMPAFAPPSAEADAKVAMSRVRNDGYNSGRHGSKVEACPYNAGTEEFVAWRDAWEDGASDLAKAKAVKKGTTNVEPASTERRPRGRPPGSRNKQTLANAA